MTEIKTKLSSGSREGGGPVSACEKCWDEAFFRSRLTGRLQADVYRELVAENEQAHATDTEGSEP